MSWRHWTAGSEQGARNLLQRRQRRVALERFRKRRGALVADLIAVQAAARRGEGLVMLVARQGRQHSARRARLTRASSASSLHSQACPFSSHF
jgi:hypothetical protein